GSMDSSSEIFSKLTKNDRRVTVIQLSRNFYKSQGAYSAGLDYVNCDAAVLLDGDLQDPPELIPKMVELWKRGYDVVYGVRKTREGSVIRNLAYKIFYRIFAKLSYVDMPRDAGDFSLLDRKVLDVLKLMPERDRYIR